LKKLLISGASGRMGRKIALLCREYGFEPVAGIDVKTEEQSDFPLYSSYALCREKADLLIDFSRAAHLPQTLRYAAEHRLPLVIGTTGIKDAHERMINSVAQHIPVLQAANFSPGVMALKALCCAAAKYLPDFDIEIIERHHAQKADAPGGTALMLYSAVAPADAQPVYGRQTALQKRSKQEIGLHALRGGTLLGTHEMGFYGPDEHLLLQHTAEDRSVFARGALKAAAWLINQPASRYDIGDVMGIKKRE